MGNIVTGRIHETALWIDFEGGHGEHALWDAAMIVDSTETKLHAIRLFMLTANKCSNAKLKASLPKHIFESLRKNKCCVAKYTYENEKWLLQQCYHENGNVAGTFHKLIPKSTQYILAWNMRAHDAKILSKIVPAQELQKYTLLDPLLWFRKYFTLPSNSLAKNSAGTPRHTMKARDYSYLGKTHTSLVDSLHMRDVTLHAALEIAKTNSSPTFETVKDTFLQKKEKEKIEDKHWMFDTIYWDSNNKLEKKHSKQFKKKLIQELENQGHKLSKEQKCAINATQKQATFQKYLTESWIHVT